MTVLLRSPGPETIDRSETPRAGSDAAEAVSRAARVGARALGAALGFVLPTGAGEAERLSDHARGSGGDLAPLRRPAVDRLCRRLLARGVTIAVDDLRETAGPVLPRGADAPAGMALCGVPLVGPDGALLGGLFVLDDRPRAWSAEQKETLADLAALAAAELSPPAGPEPPTEAGALPQPESPYLEPLFSTTPAAIALLDNDERVLRVNPAFTALFGYSAEEAAGRRINELIAPEEGLDEALSLTARVLAGEVVEFRGARRHRDGHAVAVSASAVPVKVDGRQLAAYAIYDDRSGETRAAEALQRGEERFRSLIEHSSDVVAILGAGGAVDYVSASVGPALGYAGDELAGRSVFTLLHPEDAPGVVEAFSRVLRGGPCDSLVARVAHRDGGWRTFQLRASNLLDDPAVLGVVVNARDVSEEFEATRSQRRLNAFLEATPDLVAIFDPLGRALSVNRAFRAAVGLGEDDDLSSVTLADLFPPATTELILQEGIPTAARQGVWSGETEIAGPQGRSIAISQVILAHKSAGGAVEYLSTLGRDITPQKRAEAALRGSEEHFRSLIENALDVITVLDAEGRVVSVSPAVRRVLGYEAEEVLGRRFLELIHPEDALAAHQHVSRPHPPDRRVEPLETRCRHRDGSWRVLESVCSDLQAGGVVVNSRDVSERKAAEAALGESREQLVQAQKMEAVGQLAGGVAHDFNNLLTAIRGFTDLLAAELPERDPRRAFVDEIQGAATRAASLTRQLLAFSRKQVLQPRVLDLNASVADMEKMLRRLIGEDVRFEIDLAPHPATVRADAGQVEQVLLNLAVNARDAMPEGGSLRISAARERREGAPGGAGHPGEFAVLTVSDTGTGMDEATRARVFEPFFTTKGVGKGTGLGLSTVYGIVQQSGGFVEVESEPGSGTTFRVLLPAVDADAEPERATPVRPADAASASETVLLAEDETAVRVLVRRVLDRAGYRVLEAESGPAALALLDAEPGPVHLLLTDVVMPGMSGPELAARITPRFPGMRVLYISGYTDEAIVQHGVLHPSVSFLEKPFTPEVLLRKVREVVGATAGHSPSLRP
jgi:PAS domain S-box-containing protein